MKKRFAMELRDNFWRSLEEQVVMAHERTKAIKFSFSDDRTLSYIDFLDLTRARDDYNGPELPCKFMWSGYGTYYYPYTINIGDPLLKSIIRLFHNQNLQKEYPKFCEQLNLLVHRISFFDFPTTTFRCISEMLEYIHKINRNLFQKNRMKLFLYITETKLNNHKEYEKEYKKKFPLNIKILKPEFESILKALIEDLRIKIIRKSHDIKFLMVIDYFNPKGTLRTESNQDLQNEKGSNSSNQSSAGSSDSEDSNNTPMQKHHTINEEDEEYSNIYRFAKNIQHKKLLEKEAQKSFKGLEPSNVEPSLNIVGGEQYQQENSSFLSYLVVPVYNCEDIKEESEIDTVTSSFVRYHKPLGQTKNYVTSIKGGNSLDNIECDSHLTQIISRHNHFENIGVVIEEEQNEGIEEKSRENTITQNLIADTIGETYFETAKLKGFQKFYYIYLLLISCIRFVFFRVKRPTKCVSLLIIIYISLLFIDIFITYNLFLHMKSESRDERILSGIGLYYFFFYPGISIVSPLFGLMSQVFCKTSFFKIYVMINSISCISNLFLTLVFQIIHEDRFYYIVEVLIVLFLRIICSNLANFQISIFEYRKSIKATYFSGNK